MSDFLEKDTDRNSDSSPSKNSEPQAVAVAALETDRAAPNSESNPDKKAANAPLRLVETAFLASTASLIWLVNYYFPLGPLLRVFFPIPIALVYLRWGNRAAWMSALVSGLLLSVLMGPTRSILYVMPFGIMGVLLGGLWQRQASWSVSVGLGAILGSIGFFFRFWLLSALVGQDLWAYVTAQVTEIVEWVFVKLGLLNVPSLTAIGAIAAGLILLNNIIYLFVVHLVALLLLDRLGNPIPRPPHWVQVLIDFDTPPP
ncbi:MAG: DUF2232 domain-containing protein [Oscillatoriaceae cyanobacterium Prado104]|nr:DUF2232 domain-containing protein [Oscillatoriaceae cyanobacterium Prado104]